MDTNTAKTVLLGINYGCGALFLLAPKTAMRIFGVDPEGNEAASYAVRYLGARNVLLGALLADDDGRRAVTKMMPLIGATDAAVAVLAAATGEVRKRTVLMGAVTSAVAVTAGLSLDENT